MKSIFLISIVAITMIGLIIPIEFAEARGPDEPCSYQKPNSFLKITNVPWDCKPVNYWVPEKCGIIEGLYKTDPACQAPKGPTPEELQDQRERQEQREREQREREQQQYEREQQREQQQYEREQQREQQQYEREQQQYEREQQQYEREQQREQQQYEREQRLLQQQQQQREESSNSKTMDSSESSLSFFSNLMNSISQFFNSLFPDSNVGENTRGISYEQKQKLLEYQRHMSDNSAIRHEQAPNPGRDQYLQEKYGYIPPQYRP